ncbi:MAG: hypothetical protein WAV98_01480 [Minisyncoccia bacterium]
MEKPAIVAAYLPNDGGSVHRHLIVDFSFWNDLEDLKSDMWACHSVESKDIAFAGHLDVGTDTLAIAGINAIKALDSLLPEDPAIINILEEIFRMGFHAGEAYVKNKV